MRIEFALDKVPTCFNADVNLSLSDPASFTAASRGRTPTYNDWGEISKRLENDAFRIE